MILYSVQCYAMHCIGHSGYMAITFKFNFSVAAAADDDDVCVCFVVNSGPVTLVMEFHRNTSLD